MLESANDRFILFDGTNSYASILDSLSFKGARTVEAILDVAFDTLPADGTTVFGRDTVGWRFEVDSTGAARFYGVRAGGSKSMACASATLVAGQRNVLYGLDNGTNVKLYVNGTIGSSTAVTSQTGALSVNTAAVMLMRDAAGAVNVNGRVYEAQVKLNGLVVCHLRVREATGATLHDRSGYGNDATVTGTNAAGALAQYAYASDWNAETAYKGGVLL